MIIINKAAFRNAAFIVMLKTPMANKRVRLKQSHVIPSGLRSVEMTKNLDFYIFQLPNILIRTRPADIISKIKTAGYFASGWLLINVCFLQNT